MKKYFQKLFSKLFIKAASPKYGQRFTNGNRELLKQEGPDHGLEIEDPGRRTRHSDIAYVIDPTDSNTSIFWLQKGQMLHSYCQDIEAIHCYKRALEIDRKYALAWFHKAVSEMNLAIQKEITSGKILSMDTVLQQEAIKSLRNFLAYAPWAWENKISSAKEWLAELKNYRCNHGE